MLKKGHAEYQIFIVKYMHVNENWSVFSITDIKMSLFGRGASGSSPGQAMWDL
jgi:hypothetical protein